MNLDYTITNAVRSTFIPERFLLTSGPILDMFNNQICMSVQLEGGSSSDFAYIEEPLTYKILDEVFIWGDTYGAKGSWSIIPHTKSRDPGDSILKDRFFNFTFGFVFENKEDSDLFMSTFVILNKLSA